MGELTGEILRRNPPDWGKIDPADNALIHKYENQGRKWFSRLLVLKLDPPGAEGPGGVANPMNINSFNSFVAGKLGADPEGLGWQRAAPRTNAIEREWRGGENSAQMEGSFGPIRPILENLKVGKNSGAEWDNERNVNGAVYPHGANLGYSQLQDIAYRLQSSYERYEGEQMEATGAFYHNWFNVVDGVIVVSRGISPRKMAPNRPQDKLPMHRYWSDVV
ncbi:hypothetical protein M409DRAFT_21081 [Zasmidium cellare ATCC 36951]|uniref:Uncharacterized protein n=1 Tax=Zasmidium cellare ATCC 36951 TaxID=1080233 RepID=A0A6A6CSD5_ZASCE|nr:uncharacterized protein M409DRAFT_21081 [Zasmidium cellare ATCC 36951]KAF2169070.1 hypothetical protein M409DRAFT_21081 [Zasmidium cellare ATCC 36951]